jgi:predicted dehydrogenase
MIQNRDQKPLSRVYRAAVIGCGRIGSELADDPRINAVCNHAQAYSECRATELVAVCDINREKAARCAERWNVNHFYSDVDQLLSEQNLDVVSICTPNETHSDILERALDGTALRGILAEKPLALDASDATRIVEHARERGVVLAVNYGRRYSERHQRVHEIIEAGRIGQIQRVSGLYTKGIFHNGSHWLDLARWLVGDVARVHGFHTSPMEHADPPLDTWLLFRTGASGYLHNCNSEAFTVFEMDILGTKGRARLTDLGHRYEIYAVGESPHYSGYRSLTKTQEEYGGVEDTVLWAVEDLVNCVEHGGEPRCSGRDGVEALRIASAVVSSARRCLPIDLEKTCDV